MHTLCNRFTTLWCTPDIHKTLPEFADLASSEQHEGLSYHGTRVSALGMNLAKLARLVVLYFEGFWGLGSCGVTT